MFLYDIDKKGEKSYSYQNYPFFKRDVLNKAIKEITKNTEIEDLRFDTSEKVGRKVSKIKFIFRIKENVKIQNFTEEEKTFLTNFDGNIYSL